ncbi:MAG: hypothetical protein V5B60_05205 [Accumulibacter sp.]|jgi:hypothetical protein|uniref:hypothetical protein n=1 Tax=Accumulibacter sp. TaxID=2053492 RepID=UPI002FC377FA
MSRWLLLLLLTLLAGCAGMAKVGPGEVTVRDSLAVTLDGAWNQYAIGLTRKSEVWTLDGLPLDRLVFFVGIADGEALAELAQRKDRQIPKFRASMRAHEVVEMYEVFATHDGSSFQRLKLAPAPFAGGDGFRFEFSRVRKADELEMRGIGYGAVRAGKLYLLIFEAARSHYYARNVGRFEAVVQSVRIRG